jgi:hypothetical protein
MSHFVTGLIGSAEALSHFATEHSLHSPRSLAQDLAILPLRERDLESILGVFTTGHVDGFNYLSEQLTEVLCLASIGSQLVFFETEYFGGIGSQGAVLFRDGALAYGPKAAESGPINEALSLLGVCISPPAVDEFEAIGLHAHRSSEAWLDATAPNDG